ncbi:1390_t:CDS:2, partial [Funneliformis geosporum]
MTRRKRIKKVSGQFTNSADLQNRFFAEGEERRKKGDKASGRCEWGGSHSLQEDCESLAKFFNDTNSIADDVSEIKLSANETIFNQKKQALITKIKSLNTKCQTSDSYSIATNQLSEVEKLEPKHQKELLQLEKEAQELQSAYDENVKKANDTNTSVADKNKFLLLADEVAKKAKNLKSKIKTNPLADLSRFSNLDDLEVLLKGNIPKKPPSSSGNPRNTNPSNGGENSNSNNSQQLKNLTIMTTTNEIKQKLGETTEQLENKVKEFSPYYTNLEPYQRGLILIDKYFDFDNQQSVKTDKKKQQKQILLTVLLVGLGYYFFIYLPEEENKKRIWELPINSWADREVSKIRSTLIRKYQEDASIFPDGDRNTNFSFSRSATYTIHFPPSLQEYYEKAQEEEIDSSLILREEKLILSEKILKWIEKTQFNPIRGQPDSEKKDNSALLYGAPGTGKTATMKNLCFRANRYPLVEIKGSALTPTKEDQESKLLPLKKFVYTITDQISNNALTHDPTKLRFLKDCLEGVDQSARSNNLWVFATNYLNDVDSAYATEYGIYYQLPKRWQDTNALKPEDNHNSLLNYEGDYEQFQKPTIEKVLDTRLTNIVNKIEEKMDDVLDELETSRIEGRKEITD